ncbi:ETS-related transcription factor Elf-5 isoform X1 [Bemisia tabaci]|uniref:ETS-related transcription factor Elf-5 isoform X1 n=1 Tax=Bemisia tabaci TaxID=7038 RepID=UPI003B27C3EC
MVNSANFGMMWEPNYMSQVRTDVFSSYDYSPVYPPPPHGHGHGHGHGGHGHGHGHGRDYRDPEGYHPCGQPPPHPPPLRPAHTAHPPHPHPPHNPPPAPRPHYIRHQVDSQPPNDDELANKFEQWKVTPVKLWSELDVMYWMMATAESLGVSFQEVALEKFGGMCGENLLSLSEEDFIAYDNRYGSHLYASLSELRSEPETSMSYQEEDSDSGAEVEAPPSVKRKPGRPRTSNKHKKKRDQKLGRLWEFIRDLLFNEKYCPSFICWDNYEEGTFRFVQSNQVAKLWGTIKGNTKMNYEKFSRAMRYYYKSEIFLPVEGRRLVYQFGPKATGWKTDDPNFQKSKLTSKSV